MLVPSIADKELDFWYYTASAHGPHIPSVKKVYQEQMFMLLMFSRTYPVESQTEVDITYDLKVTSPQKTITLEEKNIPYYKGKHISKVFHPSNVIDVGFDKKESFGTYHIEAVYYENVSKRSFIATAEIELVPFEQPKSFASKEEYGKWVMEYHLRPDPVRSFAAILYYIQPDPNWIEENYATLAFHRRVFMDNPFLWEYYTQLYQTVSENDKKKMLLAAAVVPSSKEKEKMFVEKIEPAMLSSYKEFSKIRILNTDKELTTGVQLDILWVEFFASGKYQPIKRLVSSLALQKHMGTIDKVKNNEIKELTKEVEEKVMLEAVYRSAIWSLTSNCLSDRLVHQYCQTIYEHESLSPEVKKSLATVLAVVEEKQQEEKKEKTLKKIKIN